MWPLVALKFRRQLGRDGGEGQGREAAPRRGTCRRRHRHRYRLPGPHSPLGWSSALGRGQPPSKEPALGRWGGGGAGKRSKVRQSWGSDPASPPHRACRLPRRPRSRSIVLTEFCRKGRGRLCFWGRWGGSKGSTAAGVRRGLSQFPHSPWRTLPPVLPPQTQSGLQIHAGMNVLSPPQRDAGVAGPCWA